METKKEKMGFGRQWLTAVVKLKDYGKLTRVSGGKMVGFVAVLLLLCYLVQYIIPAAVGAMTGTGFFSSKAAHSVFDEVPEFSISDGYFSIEEPVFMDGSTVFIYADDQVDYFSLSDLRDLMQEEGSSYEEVMVVTRNNLVLYSNGKYQEIVFEDLVGFSMTFNPEFVQGMMAFLYIIVGIGLLFMYIFSFGMYFFFALIYSLFGLLFNSMGKGRLSFGQLYRASIYAKAGPACLFALLEMIFSLCRGAGLHPYLPYQFWIRTLLTLGILFFAVSKVIKEGHSFGQGNAAPGQNPYQPYPSTPYVPYERTQGFGAPEGAQPVNPDNGRFSGAAPEGQERTTIINGMPYDHQ